MPRQLASIMAEYAEHESTRFESAESTWGPTLFTRDDAGHVRAHEFHEPDDETAIRRVQGVVADSRAAVTGLLLLAYDPEHVLIACTDGAMHIAAKALIVRGSDGRRELGGWTEITPGDESATFMVNRLREALGIDTLASRAGAIDEAKMIRRALSALVGRVDAEGHLAVDGGVLAADRLGLVELARDALELATSHGRPDKEIAAELTFRRVPTPPEDRT